METQNEKLTKEQAPLRRNKQILAISVIAALLGTISVALLITPQETFNKLTELHLEAKQARYDIHTLELEEGALKAEYELEYHLVNSTVEDF